MKFKNNSGSTMPARSVIQLTGLELQDNGEFWATADQCDNAANFLIAVTGFLQVEDQKYGECDPIGKVFLMTYDTGDGTPANEENWGPDNATFKLKKNFGGGNYAVIGADSDSELALVMHTGKVVFTGKTDSSISSGGSGTVSIWAGAMGSESDTGDNVTADENRGDAISSGKWVSVERAGSGWEVYPKECS